MSTQNANPQDSLQRLVSGTELEPRACSERAGSGRSGGTSKHKPKATHLDLFSGIGGFALAARWAGFQTIGFCEREPFAQRVLKKHWPQVPIHNDVCKLNGNEYRGIALLTGGFPCQPFSLAGKQNGKGDDRYLWPEMLRVIKGAGPDWIVGENVPGIIGLALDDVLSDLGAAGYSVRTFVLPACGVDARHRRDRVWIVANAKRLGRREDEADGNGGTLESSGSKARREWSEQAEAADDSREAKVDARRAVLSESDVCGVVDGIPSKLDECRLKGLGNAIVPQVAFQILRGIAAINAGGGGAEQVGDDAAPKQSGACSANDGGQR